MVHAGHAQTELLDLNCCWALFLQIGEAVSEAGQKWTLACHEKM